MRLWSSLRRPDRLTLAFAVAALLLGVGAVGTGAGGPSVSTAGRPDPATDEPVGAVTTATQVPVLTEPREGAAQASQLRDGILLPVVGTRDGFYEVLTPCQRPGWIPQEAVAEHRAAAEDAPRRLADATIVLDPGHGGAQPGAVGPRGLTEAAANLDIARRVGVLASEPRQIDPSTGAVGPGLEHGIPRLFLTRDAEHVAGLTYRTTLANSLDADAFVSIHNNAVPDGPIGRPGTEVYHQHTSAESKRLSGLLYEELIRTLSPLGLPWVGDFDAGVKYRLNEEGTDYYGVLRRSEVPAALVEALFISNGPEEAFLATAAGRQAIAEAIYRGLVRYITTDDPGSGFTEPYPRGVGGPSGQLPSRCADPS